MRCILRAFAEICLNQTVCTNDYLFLLLIQAMNLVSVVLTPLAVRFALLG